MEARRILHRLRHGRALSEADLQWFAEGLASGEVTDAQGTAFAMGVCKGGLSESEVVSLTRAMRDTGDVVHWDLPGPVVDKHSTGGLGDSTTFVIAPVLAALGAYAPLTSGRGLGHTGGTLDKLETIPGVDAVLDRATLRRVVAETGCAIVGASDDIAPADRRLYALRDHSGTVESPELIIASILSKKLAGGADALILDVKGGSGAFMKTRAEARSLAEGLVKVTRMMGTSVRALITDMNQPLAPAVGNALEIVEVLDVLTAPKPQSRLCQLSLVLSGELMVLAGMSETAEEGARRALGALNDGSAAERFAGMVRGLGGQVDVLGSDRSWVAVAPVQREVFPEDPGHVAAIDGTALGEVVVRLGGGRQRPSDPIHPAVGLSNVASLGDQVGPAKPLVMLHAADDDAADAAEAAIRAAFQIGDQPAGAPPLIHERID